MSQHPEIWNPLSEMHRACRGATNRRDAAVARYSFAIPNEQAVDAIASCSPNGVVELGAGLGYWARVLGDAGVDVAAFDIAPPPSADNRWFGGQEPWHPVGQGDASIVSRYSSRTLLIVWPTRNETWAADALALHHAALGTTLAVVSEPPGGQTGDDVFHAMLGHLPQCLACRYRSTNTACTCGVPVLWSQVQAIDLPQWSGINDTLGIYTRVAERRGPHGAAPRRRFSWPARTRAKPHGGFALDR